MKNELIKQTENAEFKPELESLDLSIPSICCIACVNGLNKTLTKIPGIEKVDGNSQTKIITINFQKKVVTTRQIEDAVQNQGYQIKSDF